MVHFGTHSCSYWVCSKQQYHVPQTLVKSQCTEFLSRVIPNIYLFQGKIKIDKFLALCVKKIKYHTVSEKIQADFQGILKMASYLEHF